MHVKKKSNLTFWRQISVLTASQDVLHFSGFVWTFKLLLCKHKETSIQSCKIIKVKLHFLQSVKYFIHQLTHTDLKKSTPYQKNLYSYILKSSMTRRWYKHAETWSEYE